MTGVGRYARTLRYLRVRQIVARALRMAVRACPSAAERPPLRERRAGIAEPPAREPEWLAMDRVRILNVEREMPGGIGWEPDDVPRLWKYHLHYFSDLPGRARDESSAWLADVVRSWISSCPPGTRDAWDPYPTSLRVMNWTKWLLQLPDEQRDEEMLQSLAVQVRQLERSVEHDISGNHIFANASALCAAGLLFDGEEAARWLSAGRRLLGRELGEQVLPDGGHYERSPMYHAIVLEQILDVLNISQGLPGHEGAALEGFRAELTSAAERMLPWLVTMTHPDGGPSFFNDTTMGVAPALEQLLAYASRLGLELPPASAAGTTALQESGYFRLVSDRGDTVVIFDAGPIGPDHQPGHGHCDVLSFEVSRAGRRVLVNSGVSTYEPGPERLRQRGTSAHNSARVDGEESCELWGSHRCGRRHGILSASLSGRTAEGIHTGFAHLPGSPFHHRSVEVSEGGVHIRDGFDGEGEHLVEWWLRVHPDLEARAERGGFVLRAGGSVVGLLRFPPETAPSLGESTWHPGFNLCRPCPIVTATWRGRLPADFEFEIIWE